MSDPKNPDTGKGKIPDYRRAMMVLSGDAKGHALNKILSSDKDNAVKAVIHNVFALSAVDTFARWEGFEDESQLLTYFLNGKSKLSTDEAVGYRINSRALEGFATTSYVEGFKAWTLTGAISGAAQSSDLGKLEEGNKKK